MHSPAFVIEYGTLRLNIMGEEPVGARKLAGFGRYPPSPGLLPLNLSE